MAVLDGCTNLLAQVCSTVAINTSNVVEYDGPSFACIPLPASPSTLNQVLKAIDDEVCNIKNNLLVDIDTSSITTYDGTPTFTCFTLTAGGTLNTIIDEIGTAICANDTRLDNFATSDVLTYDGTPSWACFTLTASPTLNSVINDLGDEICTNQTNIAAKADKTLLETYTTELRQDYVETGGDTANIGPGITIDIERTAGGNSVYYVLGVRDSVATETIDDTVGTPARKRLSASSDNYLDFDTDSDYTVTAVPNGNPAPGVAGMRMWKIVTDGSSITGTTDLRNTTPLTGVDISDATITNAKMVANTLTSASMSNVVSAGTTNIANVTVDAAGRVTTIATDFDLAGPTDLDLIQFQSGTGKWENVTVASVGLLLPSGVAGQTLRSDGASWLANSVLYNNGTNIGIGTTSPTEQLMVAGNISPEADATRDLGTSSIGWSNLYMSSNIHYTSSLTFTRSSVDQLLFGDNQFVFGAVTGDASAILEISSTTKGFLPPKMTTAQRNAIAAPVEGLTVYDSDLNSPFYFDGGSWVNVIGGPDADWVIVGSDVQLNTTGHVLPNTDDTNDLGSSSLRFRDLYLGSVIDYNQNLDFKSGGTVRISFENAGKVGIGTTAAVNTSALVEFVSTTSGFLPPRMTTAQKNAIGSPAEGLFIYDTDLNDVQFFTGAVWMGTSIGNDGIYTGSGSLSGATIVTMGTNNFQMDTTGRSGMLFIDGTNDRFGIGLTNPAGALEVRQTANTTIFRCYNTAFAELFSVTTTAINFTGTTGSSTIDTATGHLHVNGGTGVVAPFAVTAETGATTIVEIRNFPYDSEIFEIKQDASKNGIVTIADNTNSETIVFSSIGNCTFDTGGNIVIGGTASATSAVDSIAMYIGTAPTALITDGASIYVADHSGVGTATVHIRNEEDDIIKFFKAAALTAVDATAIDAVYDATEQGVLNNVRTRLNEIEALLQAAGLLT